MFRSILLATLCTAPFALDVEGGATKKASNAWAKIVVEFVTADMSKKALEFERNALVNPDTELRFDVKRLGGKISASALKKKFGTPAKVEKYAVKEDGKVVSYEELHYPPISFAVVVGTDQVATLAAPKRIWTGAGILENAKSALKK